MDDMDTLDDYTTPKPNASLFLKKQPATKVEETVTYAGIIIAETPKAVQFLIVPTDEKYSSELRAQYDKVWFPLSQTRAVHRTRSVLKNTLDGIVVSAWSAKAKGLLG